MRAASARRRRPYRMPRFRYISICITVNLLPENMQPLAERKLPSAGLSLLSRNASVISTLQKTNSAITKLVVRYLPQPRSPAIIGRDRRRQPGRHHRPGLPVPIKTAGIRQGEKCLPTRTNSDCQFNRAPAGSHDGCMGGPRWPPNSAAPSDTTSSVSTLCGRPRPSCGRSL